MSHDRTASPASSAPVKLEVHDIHKRYGAHEVLKGVSLTAHAGDVISIIGSSGSGKSTLLRCINLLERPQQGRIVVAAEQLQLRPGRDGALEASDPRQLQRLRPPQGLLGEAMGAVISPGLAQQLRAVWEAMNNGWNQWVLNYTQSRQLDLLKALGMQAPNWHDLLRLLAGAMGLAGLGGAAWALWQRQRTDPWARLLQRTRQRLARAGLPLPEHLPPRAMASQVHAQFGPASLDVCAWLLRLERARYAPGSTSRQQLAPLQRQWRQLRWPRPRSTP